MGKKLLNYFGTFPEKTLDTHDLIDYHEIVEMKWAGDAANIPAPVKTAEEFRQ